MTRPHRLAGPFVLVALGALAMPLCAQEQPSVPAVPGIDQPPVPADVPIRHAIPIFPGTTDIEIRSEPPIRAVLRELNKKTDVTVDQMPLNRFVEFLTKRYKIQFKLDRAALRQLGISESLPFSMAAGGLPLNLALERNLRPLGLRTRVVDGIVFITADVPGQTAMAPPRRVPAHVAAALQAKTDIEVQILPLDRFVQFLTAKYKIPFELDPNGLERVNVHPSTPVSAQLEGITLDQALRQILGRFRLTYRVVGGRVFITDKRMQAEQPRMIGERRGLPVQRLLQPRKAAERLVRAGRPQLARTLKPLIEAELLFVKKVCTASKEELEQIRKGVETYVDNTNPGAVATASNFVREPLDELVEKHLTRAKADLYRAECQKRKAFERQACVHSLVAQLDRELCLSTAQREAISASLAAKWDESWQALIELVAVEGTRLVPQIPDDLIEPHLESPQLEIWINLPKVGSMNWRFQSPNLSIMGIPAPDWEDD